MIDEEGEQLGVMTTDRALELAQTRGLDLVEVSPTARPPVCRIMDFGRYKYEESKKKKESKKKQHSVQIKEVKFRPKTEEHDYQFKKRHAEEFLGKHCKLKLTIMFRGREMAHRERGEVLLKRLIEDLSHVGTVEREPKFEGRLMVMYMSPLSQQQSGSKKQPTAKAAPTEKKEVDNAETQDQPGSGETVS